MVHFLESKFGSNADSESRVFGGTDEEVSAVHFDCSVPAFLSRVLLLLLDVDDAPKEKKGGRKDPGRDA